MPKNIVLLSDGTGNSAAKPFKTNVWRFYQAVDINSPQSPSLAQVAYYDDGVGTENFKPLAYLGLALGLGLQKNVKKLYTFLCRNYSKGDNIFLIGFSRGAFTVRVLAGLILRCGLVHADDESELTEQVDLAYNAYKWDGVRRAFKTRRALAFNALLWLTGQHAAGRNLKYVPLGDKIEQRFPKIAFIGVWDTVDAYGMPVDEIKLGIDRLIYPMTLADRDLSPLVDRACQALSLDDERPTFRPVLWSEMRKVNGRDEPVSERQLTQVWFAGVHANVGGGYPDDGLAHVAMQWMMDEAQREGLWFYDDERKEIDRRVNKHGKQYDSRSGLAGYYRYGPRSVDALCNDDEHGVTVPAAKVHASALARIGGWEVPYAPVSFPSQYTVMARGPANPGSPPPPLMPQPCPEGASIPQRVSDMNSAWDAVAHRRWAYLATVWLTVVLVVVPLGDKFFPRLFDWVSTLITTAGDAIRRLPLLADSLPWLEKWIDVGLGYVAGFIPGWAGLWFTWYRPHPLFFVIAAGLLAWLFVRKSAQLQRDVFAHADFAWRRLRAAAPTAQPPRSLTRPVVGALRAAALARGPYRALTEVVIPLFIAAFLGILALPITVFYLPKTFRLIRLRRKYKVGPTTQKPGTDAIVPQARIKAGIQPLP
ncbi:MAG TPA: DUF2235 domain-containing protein [Pseudolabrys sp.]|jgi:uncharacterized protein (DUF2235 family)|nr:DUF2235 domain-containing protein [Pseudolabrys sp.]